MKWVSGWGGDGEGCVLVKSDGALLFIEQNVVRNWYARLPQITNNARNLIDNAEEAAKALIEGELCIKVSGASSTIMNFLFNPTFGMWFFRLPFRCLDLNFLHCTASIVTLPTIFVTNLLNFLEKSWDLLLTLLWNVPSPSPVLSHAYFEALRPP